MFKYIFIIFVLFYNCAFSQVKIDSSGAMVATGNYPATKMRGVKAFMLSVESITERDNIPDNFRDTGMVVLVREDSALYTLVGGTGNGNWQEYFLSGTGGRSVIIIDSAIVDLDGLHPIIEIPLTQSGFKTINVISEGDNAVKYNFSFSPTSVFLKWQVALLGTFKFYIIYFF